jgi:hypothetical protein
MLRLTCMSDTTEASGASQNHLILERSSSGDVSAQNVQLTGAPADSFFEHSVLDSAMTAA